MKKIEVISFKAVWNIVLISGLIATIFWIVSLSKTETHKLDLTHFSGRVIESEYMRPPKTFIINVPMSEALKFGKDAILSYSEDGVVIWKPDTTTSGASLCATLRPDGIRVFEISRTDQKMILKSHAQSFDYIACIVVMLCVLGLAIISIRKTFILFAE